jgi:hypothetical protein
MNVYSENTLNNKNADYYKEIKTLCNYYNNYSYLINKKPNLPPIPNSNFNFNDDNNKELFNENRYLFLPSFPD